MTGVIDHVYYSSNNLSLLRHVTPPTTFPSLAAAREHLLPSLSLPSDHYPVCVDLGPPPPRGTSASAATCTATCTSTGSAAAPRWPPDAGVVRCTECLRYTVLTWHVAPADARFMCASCGKGSAGGCVRHDGYVLHSYDVRAMRRAARALNANLDARGPHSASRLTIQCERTSTRVKAAVARLAQAQAAVKGRAEAEERATKATPRTRKPLSMTRVEAWARGAVYGV